MQLLRQNHVHAAVGHNANGLGDTMHLYELACADAALRTRHPLQTAIEHAPPSELPARTKPLAVLALPWLNCCRALGALGK
jgi:hypothetical protein